MLKRYWDVMFGTGGFFGALTLAQWNQVVALAVGVATLCVLGFRLRREWRNRNQPPNDPI